MRDEIDVLASAIHDAKNQLFYAETAAAEIEFRENVDLSAVRGAIDQAGNRLLRALTFYRVLTDGVSLGITPVAVCSILEDGLAVCAAQLGQFGVEVDFDCTVNEVWPLDRDLIVDLISNAAQNAARHARSRIRVAAEVCEGALLFTVEDDGPGFASLDLAEIHRHGTGLYVAQRIAYLHVRDGRHGEVRLRNHGRLDGAVFELRLP